MLLGLFAQRAPSRRVLRVGCGVMGWGVARAAAGAPASAEAAVKERLRAALLFFGRPQGVQFGLIQKEVYFRVSEA